MVQFPSNVGNLLQTATVFILFLNNEVRSQTYPDSPDSTQPSQWTNSNFDKHCSPFGVSMFAEKAYPRDKFVHACNVMAQMLDNDQDGCADDINVVQKIRLTQSGMAMYASENSETEVSENFAGQPLYADETQPSCSGSSETASCRDAAIEEILHVVTGKGVGVAYTNDFSDCYTNQASINTMQKQMDIARGGHFTTIPSTYPSGSIYHYDDATCDYRCMATEFIYWALTSLLDGQGKCKHTFYFLFLIFS